MTSVCINVQHYLQQCSTCFMEIRKEQGGDNSGDLNVEHSKLQRFYLDDNDSVNNDDDDDF